ncbi:hypothetical protein NDGK_02305 [Clostridiales bacterium CHKCI001]|nr:hypothetical protein NDGK_02305 [Clostridiales bacterium CHKCI001]
MKDKKEGEESSLWYVIFLVAFLVVTVFLSSCLYCHAQKMSQLEEQLQLISDSIENSQTEIGMNTNILSYMESEMANYREFIQREREYLMWLLGVLIGGIIMLLGFFGWSTKKEIKESVKEIFQKKAEDIIEKKMIEYISDPNNENGSTQKRLEYLRNAVTREENHQKMRIKFFTQKEKLKGEQVLKDARELLSNKGLNIQKEEKIDFGQLIQKSDDEIKRYFNKFFNECDILVYEVNYLEELEESSNSDSSSNREIRAIYKIISELAEKDHYCIFYVPTPSGIGRKPLVLNSSVYCAIANTGIPLIQQILTLLDC